jgi:hypothetical protein
MVIVLLVLPVVICLSMSVVAGVLGWLTKDDVEGSYPADSEYVALGK